MLGTGLGTLWEFPNRPSSGTLATRPRSKTVFRRENPTDEMPRLVNPFQSGQIPPKMIHFTACERIAFP
jgi:hypothetical protein